jgi:hypothetical protein
VEEAAVDQRGGERRQQRGGGTGDVQQPRQPAGTKPIIPAAAPPRLPASRASDTTLVSAAITMVAPRQFTLDELDALDLVIAVADGVVTSTSSPTCRPISARPSGEL